MAVFLDISKERIAGIPNAGRLPDGGYLLQIMEQDRVWTNDVAGVVGKVVSAVIDDRFESPNGAEDGRLAVVELGDREAEGKANAVYGDGFQWVVVKCAVGKGHGDVVMHRVDVPCFHHHYLTKTNGER